MSFFQDPPKLENQYDDDAALQEVAERLVPEDARKAMVPTLRNMGELAAGELLELARKHEHDEPRHIPYDPWGQRIDQVTVSPSWERYAEVAATEGLVATGYERKSGPYSRLHQFALVYLFDRSSQLYTCPLAMTDGCARTLETIAEGSLKDRTFPHLISRDPNEAWTSGQWMTERTGGSDVGKSETEARNTKDGWRLYGTKWFTSAVTSEVALALARPEGNPEGGKGLALFHIPLRDESGRLQGIRVNRLKNKLGTKLLPTAELTLDGAHGEPVAGLTNGIRNMASMLNITRTWNTICALASMRRSLAWARAYAPKRVAFGAPLSEKPLHLDTLAGMAAEYEAALQLAMRSVHLLGREETESLSPSEASLLRVIQPAGKLMTGKQAVAIASEMLECFGGAGYVEDTGLPEMLRDAQVLPIWEGTTNVLSLETFRAVQRADAWQPLQEEVQRATGSVTSDELRVPADASRSAMEHALAWWEAHAGKDPVGFEGGARRFSMTVSRSLSLALLCEHAQWALDQGKAPRAAAAAQRFARHGVDLLEDSGPDPAWTKALALG